jgi:protein-tyrosine phosphatase
MTSGNQEIRQPIKVLFVCLGNICRSPAAEGVFKKMISELGHSKNIFCDSAGPSAYHKRQNADSRMGWAAKQRGYELTSLSRPIEKEDLKTFDYILTMDPSNFENVLALDPEGPFTKKIIPFVNFCTLHKIEAVPDPYYRGAEGFEWVMDILEDGCRGLMDCILAKNFNSNTNEN